MDGINKRLCSLAIAAAMAISLVACGEQVTDVSIAEASARVGVGETRQVAMEYSFNKEVATAEQASVLSAIGVKYAVADSSIATVSEDGSEITGVATGETSLIVSANNSTFEIPLVVYTPISSLKPEDITISTADEWATPECAVLPQNAQGELTYSVEDETVATVSDDVIIPKAAGETTLYVVSDNGTIGSATITVLQATANIFLTPESAEVAIGGTDAIAVSGDEGAQAGLDNLTWASSDEEVATVAEDGTVTGVAEGTATITVANAYGISASTDIEVKAAPQKASGGSANGGAGSAAGAGSASASGSGAAVAYGALPLAEANTGTWWGIDSTDSAYWATAENINAYRAEVGLPALTVSDSLSAIANARCGQLTTNYSHDGMQTPGEIIGCNYNSAQSVCQAWYNSPGHYAQMTNASWTQMGIGCFFYETGDTFWCVVFQ